MKPCHLRFLALGLALLALVRPVIAVIEVRGEFLYLRPSLCNTHYAIVVDDFNARGPVGKVQEVHADHEPGFRISVGYLECSSKYDITLGYTYLHQRRHSEAQATGNQGLWPAFGRPQFLNNTLSNATARARFKFDYDAVDLQVGHRSVHDPGILCLRAFGALHYAHIARAFDANYEGRLVGISPFTALVRSHSRAWGIGPKVGVDLRLELFCKVGIGGLFAVGLLAGDQQRDYSEVTQNNQADPVPSDLLFHSDLALFSSCHARLGLNYCWCCSCMTALFEVGYEFINYLNAIEVVNFTGPNSTFNILCQDARLDGVYASLRVDF